MISDLQCLLLAVIARASYEHAIKILLTPTLGQWLGRDNCRLQERTWKSLSLHFNWQQFGRHSRNLIQAKSSVDAQRVTPVRSESIPPTRVPTFSNETGLPGLRFGVEFEFDTTHISAHSPYNLRNNIERVKKFLTEHGLRVRTIKPTNLQESTEWYLFIEGTSPPLLEITSPILEGLQGLNEVKNMCEALSMLGVKCPKESGLHVHVDANDVDAEHMARLVLVHHRLEQVCGLLDCVAPSRHQNRFCAETSDRLLLKARQGPITRADKEVDKHKSLNLFTEYGTAEFRRHEGTTRFAEVVSWIVLCLFLVASSRDVPRDASFNDLRKAFTVLGMYNHCPLAKESATYLLERQLASRKSAEGMETQDEGLKIAERDLAKLLETQRR